MADERDLNRERNRDRGADPELWLGELLDAAAARYEPDTERLRALVTARIAQQDEQDEQHAAGAAPRRARRGRRLGLLGRVGLAGIPAGVALATVGAAAAIAVGATATIAVTSSHAKHTVTVAAPTTSAGVGGPSSQSQAPTESASPVTTGASTHPATAGGSGPTGASTSSGPGIVTATASIDHGSSASWTQLDVVVTIKQPLTALHVTVKVSKCDGLASAGSWNSGAGGQFTEATTTDSAGAITYEFELAKGRTLSPGTLTFAAQFSHASSGWNPAHDTFYVSARTATSTGASSVGGAF